MDQDKLNNQSKYWEANFSEKPMMFGLTPSVAALSSFKKFKEENIKEIVELGAGFGNSFLQKIKLDDFLIIAQQQSRLLKRKQKVTIFQN